MNRLSPEALTPRALNNNEERRALGSAAMSYLWTPTEALDSHLVSELADMILLGESGGNVLPEQKYYAGWALLDAALPGYFSVDDSPVITTGVNSRQHLDEGLRHFHQLTVRTPFFEMSTAANSQGVAIQPEKLLFGLRAGMIDAVSPVLSPLGEETDPRDISKARQVTLKRVYTTLSERGALIRNQIIQTEWLLRRQNTGVPKAFLQTLLGNLRGIETEHAFLGAMWTANLVSNSFDTFAMPASVRTDYAMTRREPKADVVVHHNGNKYGFELVRDKVADLRRGGSAPTDSRIFAWYGDRDSRLPPMAFDADNRLINSPSFAGYLEEAHRVQKQVIDTIERGKSDQQGLSLVTAGQ